jgi:hypothetical protein
VIKINGRVLLAACLALLVVVAFAVLPDGPRAQKAQENYKDKFNIADSQGGVAVATSADGKYVYVAGPAGVIVSDDHGKTGSWVQTAKLK